MDQQCLRLAQVEASANGKLLEEHARIRLTDERVESRDGAGPAVDPVPRA